MNNEVGTFDYVTSNYVLAGAKRKLGLRDTTLEDAFLKDLINECVGTQLRNAATRIQQITQLAIERVGGITPRAKLPVGFIRLSKNIPIVYVNAQGKAISGTNSADIVVTAVSTGGTYEGSTNYGPISVPVMNSTPTAVNGAFYENNPYGAGLVFNGSVYVESGYLYFSQDVTADFVKVAYLSLKIDDNGELMIPSLCSPAIEAYACWGWCLSNFTTHGAVAPAHEKIWKNQKRMAKANFNLPSSLDYAVINRTMNSLI